MKMFLRRMSNKRVYRVELVPNPKEPWMRTFITEKGTLFGQADTRRGEQWPEGYEVIGADQRGRPCTIGTEPTKAFLLNAPEALLKRAAEAAGKTPLTRWIIEAIEEKLA